MSHIIKVNEIFPVPLIIIDLKNSIENLENINKQLIQEFVNNLINDGYRQTSGTGEVYQSLAELEIKCTSMCTFLKLIKPICDEAFKKIDYNTDFIENYDLCEVWGNLTTGFSSHAIHVHGRGQQHPFSMVYFPCKFCDPSGMNGVVLKSSSSDRIGKLKFHSPGWEVKQISFVLSGSKNNKFLDTTYSVCPEEGILIIFPSYLAHSVAPSFDASENNARISFSFFAKFKSS